MRTRTNSRNRRTGWILLATLALTTAASAESSDFPIDQSPYFPINVGDTWTYGYQVPGQPRAFESRTIDRSEDDLYFHIDNLHGKAYWIDRTNASRSKSIQVWDTKQYRGGYRIQNLELVYEFPNNPDNRPSWSVDLYGNLLLSGTVSVGANEETVITPAGTFTNCRRLDWQTNVMDAGVQSEWFAPGVGLVRYTTSSLLGTIDHRLERARVAGRTYPQAPALSGLTMGLHLDRSLYVIDKRPTQGGGQNPPTLIQATLRLENRSQFPVTLDFSSGQVYDLVIRDQRGNKVWRWSSLRLFRRVVWQKTIPMGGVETIRETISLRIQGLDLTDGVYSLEFTTASRQRFAGIVAFEVKTAY